MTAPKKHTGNTLAVDEYMAMLDHPLKAEAQAVREIIKNVAQGITEQVKWNAPSFSYKGNYVVTFNLHTKEYVLLVFHNPAIAMVHSEILEGDYKDRRLVYIKGMSDLDVKKPALEKVVKDLLELIDRNPIE
jgi:uncharacterized protein YdhG (YjbR/CyaY superfamily)